MASTSKRAGDESKDLLEKKIRTLEQRLVLVERFVEMRFCETFRDFSVRNLSAAQFDSVTVADKPQGTKETGEGTPKKVGGKGFCSTTKAGPTEDDYCLEGNPVFSPPPSPSPPSPNVGDHDNDNHSPGTSASTTTYRTRSGRKSTRLTGTALGIRSKDKSPSKKVESAGSSKQSGGKTLRITVHRLDDANISSGTKGGKDVKRGQRSKAVCQSESGGQDNTDNVEMYSVIKTNEDSENEGDVAGAAEGDDGNDYFMFPPEEPENRKSAEPIDEDAVGMDDDGDWDPSEDEVADDDNDEDYENKPGSSKRKLVKKGSGLSSKKAKVPYNIKLLPEGATLQRLDQCKDNRQECPICHIHVKPEIYDNHVQTHARERHHKCSVCGMGFFRRSSKARHEKRHSTNFKKNKCRICSKGCEYPSDALKHERSCIAKHLGEGLPVDPQIIEDVRQKSQGMDLRWPIAEPGEEQVPKGMKKCFRCKQIVVENQYFNHLKEVHASWKCSFCDKVYVEKTGLVRHLCTSHGDSRVTCDMCKKTFESAEDYRKHYGKCHVEQKQNSGETDTNSDTEVNSN